MLVKQFKKGELELPFVKDLIVNVDHLFIPKLSTEIDIIEYSKKLQKQANCILLYENSKIAAFLFYYILDANEIAVYITMISSIKKGCGSLIYHELVTTVSPKFVRLEVDTQNHDAISFYKKLGFKKELEKVGGKKLILRHEIR